MSIVTPSFNHGPFIAEAIQSVLDQDYPAIEYIVMDGGSTDGTLGVLKRYESRLRWFSAPDDGQSDSINRGFAGAHGEILAWLNADDRFVPGAVSRGVRALSQDLKLGFVYGLAEHIDRSGRVEDRQPSERWDLNRLIDRLNFVAQPATFFRRDAYLAVGGLDRDLHYCMDYDLWIKLGNRYTALYVPEVWAQMRMYRDTKTASGGLARIAEMRLVVRRYGRSHIPVGYHFDVVRAAWRAGLAASGRGMWRSALSDWRQGWPYVVSPYFLSMAASILARRGRRLITRAVSRVGR